MMIMIMMMKRFHPFIFIERGDQSMKSEVMGMILCIIVWFGQYNDCIYMQRRSLTRNMNQVLRPRLLTTSFSRSLHLPLSIGVRKWLRLRLVKHLPIISLRRWHLGTLLLLLSSLRFLPWHLLSSSRFDHIGQWSFGWWWLRPVLLEHAFQTLLIAP